jgi:hypothetical protein
MHGQALLARIETGPLWHGPALRCPSAEPEIIVQARRSMFARRSARQPADDVPDGRLARGFSQVTLPRYRCMRGYHGAFHRSLFFGRGAA